MKRGRLSTQNLLSVLLKVAACTIVASGQAGATSIPINPDDTAACGSPCCTQPEWTNAWSTAPSDGVLTAVLQGDLHRCTQPQGGTGVFEIDLSDDVAWPDGSYRLQLNCAGHALTWDGDDGPLEPTEVLKITTRPALSVEIEVAACTIRNESVTPVTPSGTVPTQINVEDETDGLRVDASGPTNFRLQDSTVSYRLKRGLVVNPSPGHEISFVVENNRINGRYDDIANDGLLQSGHSLVVRNNLISDGNGGVGEADDCMELSGDLEATVTTSGNDNYYCDGLNLDGISLTSASDHYQAIGRTSERSAMFSVGALQDPESEDPPASTSVAFENSVVLFPSAPNVPDVLFSAAKFGHIRADLHTPTLVHFPGGGTCSENEPAVPSGLFSSDGHILDIDTDGGPGELSLVMHTFRAEGRQCGPGDGDPNSFLTDCAKIMCGGVCDGRCGGICPGLGKCRGSIEIPGLGRWKIDGERLVMQPGNFNVRGDDFANGAAFCSAGPTDPGSIVDAGLSCAEAWNAATGTPLTAGCSESFTAGQFYDVRCER